MDTGPIEPRLDIISDAICPWCYIGKRQVERALPLLAEQGLSFAVHWHPFQLNPEMPEGGVDRREYRLQKFGSVERIAEMDKRIVEAAAGVGLDFHPELMRRTPNTVAAHRVVWLAEREGVSLQDAVVERLFRGYFCEGADIGDADTLASLAAEAGMAREKVTSFLAGDEGKREVLAEDSAARHSGLNGVPSFVMQQHLLFSGAVPADAMAEAFAKAWRILEARAA
jgi:predicted DsbA family dithiol-disulfide isomerase